MGSIPLPMVQGLVKLPPGVIICCMYIAHGYCGSQTSGFLTFCITCHIHRPRPACRNGRTFLAPLFIPSRKIFAHSRSRTGGAFAYRYRTPTKLVDQRSVRFRRRLGRRSGRSVRIGHASPGISPSEQQTIDKVHNLFTIPAA